MNTPFEGPSRMTFYTDMAFVFQALGGRQKEFNWLVTDFEGHITGDEWNLRLSGFEFNSQPKWLNGAVLTDFVEQNDIQFVWGVLSAFARGVVLDPRHLEVEPYADGNGMFWGNKVTPQHPQATAEVVCWDSTLTLLLSKDDDLSKRFRAFFPEAVDLDEHNRERERRRARAASGAA